MRRTQVNRAGFRLSRCQPLFRRLYAVVQAVAHQVHQGIIQLIDDRLVEFGITTVGDQHDIFAKFRAEIADQPAAGGPVELSVAPREQHVREN